jgi:hypothetical protein
MDPVGLHPIPHLNLKKEFIKYLCCDVADNYCGSVKRAFGWPLKAITFIRSFMKAGPTASDVEMGLKHRKHSMGMSYAYYFL